MSSCAAAGALVQVPSVHRGATIPAYQPRRCQSQVSAASGPAGGAQRTSIGKANAPAWHCRPPLMSDSQSVPSWLPCMATRGRRI